MNGKTFHDMVLKYKLFPIQEYSNLWLDSGDASYFITNATMIVFQEDGSVVLVLDRWVPTVVDGITIPTLAIKHVEKPFFSFS
jgi:hypothetical protein